MADILENPVDLIDDAYEQEIQVEQEMIEVVAYRSYNQLDDKPQINGVELVGNKTSSDLGITAQIESAVNSEAQARVQADNTLQNKIDTEKLARQQADSTLQGRIDAEGTARQNADNGLQTQIDAITSKSDVVDVVANYAALQAYDTSSLGNNDVIKVLDDETHEDALTYYRWSTTTQTWSYIGQEAPYYSKGQMDVKLAEKQDKLTAGANIQIQNGTISATDTTYTAGNGLSLNGTEFSADTTVLATKSDLEGYYTKTETDTKLAPKLETEVVAELPATGTEGKLYLTPKNYTRGTGTGNPIEATITDEAGKMDSFKLDGDTFQQTYTGRNILPNTLQTQTINGVTFTRNADGSITIKGTATARTEPKLWQSSDGGSLIFSSGKNYFNTTSRAIYYYANGYYTMFANSASGAMPSDRNCSYAYIRVESGESIDTTIYPQIVEGDAALDYEPFVGGAPSPNPDYPQPIQTVTGEQTVEIVGKNLFDKSTDTIGYYLGASGNITSGGTWSVSDYIAVIPGENYTISGVGTQGQLPRYCFYDSNKQFVSAVVPGNQTVTVPSGANYIRLSVYNGTGGQAQNDETTLQLEFGSTATAYAPYQATSYPLNLGSIELCKLGTYQDYIFKDGEDWKIRKQILPVTVDGNTSITPNPFGTNSYAIEVSQQVMFVTNQLSAICEYFYGIKYDDRTQEIPNSVFIAQAIGQTKVIIVRNTGFTTVGALSSWFDTYRPTFYCTNTATDTVITDAELIAQLEAIRTASLENGTNTITNSTPEPNLTGDMEIGYYGYNPTNRYDKWLWLDLNNNYEQIGS